MDPLTAALEEIESNGEKEAVKKESATTPTDDKKPSDEIKHVTKRTKLPVTQPDKNNQNLWSFLKQCIGKELTKISMPVQWNEPISLLQRVAEYMNYAYLLKKASLAKASEDRLELVATFAVSALASNFERMGKPFNPLLGETYELTRNDFRIVCEQVGHHPPVSAWHATGKDGDSFVFHGSIYPKVKFWGKSVEFKPQGVCTLKFPEWEDEAFTWSNVNCIIHNVIVGTLWMEQHGTMEIVNHKTKAKCVLNFKQGGWFSSGCNDLHTVEGFLLDQHKKKKRFIYGRWTEFICSVDIESLEQYLNVKVTDKSEPNASNLPKHAPFELCDIPNSKVLWHVDPRPEDSSQYYNFSNFTMGLNEFDTEGEHKNLCSSDSRHRPDIRALENGDLEMAAKEKERLETKQREVRKPYKNCKKESEWWNPRWFMPSRNEYTKDSDDWKFIDDYWNKSKVPEGQADIF